MTRMRSVQGFVLAVLTAAAGASCGDVVRDGRSPVFLVINQLTVPDGNVLLSDVLVLLRSPAPCTAEAPCPTIFNDLGTVNLTLMPKDVTAGPTAPTTNSSVTISRYRVRYTRADGRNTPGVDVPYGFDGAATGTVTVGGSLALSFELVRHIAKQESPLAQLAVNSDIITTIAEVTFWGEDRVGNDISVTGQIQVNFGNFADTN